MNKRAYISERIPWNMDDPKDVQEAITAYKAVLTSVTKEQNRILNIDLQRTALDTAVGQLAFFALRKRTHSGRVEQTALKDMKRQINIELKRQFGERASLLPQELAEAYAWCLDLDERLRSGRIPLWLM